MSKIVKAINSMISNKNKLEPILLGPEDHFSSSQEFFFTYDNKYNWSMTQSEKDGIENHLLFYYKMNLPLKQIANIVEPQWSQEFASQFITYSSYDIGTKEAKQSFKELYLYLKEKALGIDDVLDDIIKDLHNF